jgi:hypothetical protein
MFIAFERRGARRSDTGLVCVYWPRLPFAQYFAENARQVLEPGAARVDI